MLDMRGISLSTSNLLMSSWRDGLRGRWPALRTVKSPEVMDVFHWTFSQCWFCGVGRTLEAHHIFGGAKRTDERTNLAMVCGDLSSLQDGFKCCHRKIESGEITLSDVLKAKIKYDRWHTDWLRLVWIARQYLEMED